MPTSEDQSENLVPPNFSTLEKRVFTTSGGAVFIGGELVTEQMLSTLRDESKYIFNSRFYQVFSATITNESANMALIQSTRWEHVETAKMLHHLGHVLDNMLYTLSKK